MLTTKGVAIALDALTDSELKAMQKELTVTPESNAKYQSPPDSYKVYMMSKKNIYVPRRYKPYTRTGIPTGDTANALNFAGTLKESTNQPEAVREVVRGLTEHGSGILSLPTGYGKTTVALYVMCQLKRKTLIVVHKEFLMNQWIERIQQFVPSASIGKVQANVIDIEGKDVVIGMLKSLSMKEYDKRLFHGFGFTIIDETHHVCTRTFSRMLMKINSTYLLGLSATLERKDGLTKVLHWFLGDVLFKVERKRQMHVEVERVDFRPSHYQVAPFPLNRARQPNVPEGINVITVLPERNRLLFDIISAKLVERRHILVLTDRRNHCTDLLTYCAQQLPEETFGLYIGGMKPEELKQSEQCAVIFATFSLAHEGLDIPTLDTLILATPKSDIVQSVGRILRETQGKKNAPCVVDIVDQWGPFKYQYFKRLKYYKATGFHIQHQEETSELSEDPFSGDAEYAFCEDD